MTKEKIYYFRIELLIAKLYLFLLPIRMFNVFDMLTIYLKDTAKYIDIILNVLGIILILMRFVITKKKNSINRNRESLFGFFVFMVTIFNISSLIMTCFIDYKYGEYSGESAFSAALKMIMIYIQYVLMIFYNKEIFKLLGIRNINEVLYNSTCFVLIIGYIQLAITMGISVIEPIYNKLDIFNVLEDSVITLKMPLTESEGALAGDLMAIFILPFLASNAIVQKKNKKYIIPMIAYIPLIIISGSLSAYILCTVFCATLIYYLYKKNKNTKVLIYTLVIVIVLVCICFIFYNIIPADIRSKIDYTIRYKFTDGSNGSTVARTVIPFKYNFGAFKEYPILGVGNGNQGYFYYDYVEYKYSNVSGVKTSYNNAANTIYNGGLLFPSIISGYGILGIILVCVYIRKSEKQVNNSKEKLGNLYYYYKIARIPFLVAGFQTLFVGTYYVWFVLSIPHFCSLLNKEE